MESNLLSRAAGAVTQRMVLLLNHLLASEPEAARRMLPHAGRTIGLRVQTTLPIVSQWPALLLRITPAGLLEMAHDVASPAPDLSVVIDAMQPLSEFGRMLQGERPRVEVAGDAALAANVNWLFDNLRWEPHDDLARLFGAAPATELERAARMAGGAARRAAVWAFGLVPRGASSSGARGRRTG